MAYTEQGENHLLWFSMGFVRLLYTSVESYYTYGVAHLYFVCLRRVPWVVLTSFCVIITPDATLPIIRSLY